MLNHILIRSLIPSECLHSNQLRAAHVGSDIRDREPFFGSAASIQINRAHQRQMLRVRRCACEQVSSFEIVIYWYMAWVNSIVCVSAYTHARTHNFAFPLRNAMRSSCHVGTLTDWLWEHSIRAHRTKSERWFDQKGLHWWLMNFVNRTGTSQYKGRHWPSPDSFFLDEIATIFNAGWVEPSAHSRRTHDADINIHPRDHAANSNSRILASIGKQEKCHSRNKHTRSHRMLSNQT